MESLEASGAIPLQMTQSANSMAAHLNLLDVLVLLDEITKDWKEETLFRFPLDCFIYDSSQYFPLFVSSKEWPPISLFLQQATRSAFSFDFFSASTLPSLLRSLSILVIHLSGCSCFQ